MNRVFVHSGAALDYRAWLGALKRGRTFVSNGPLLSFALEGREAGDEIALPAGGRALSAKIGLRSIVPVERLEVVRNGDVVATVPLSEGGTRADATISIPVSESSWLTLRAWSPGAAEPVLDIYPFATMSPVYVTVGGRPIRNAGDARYFTRWIERIAEAAAAHPGWNDETEKKEVLARIAQAKAVFQQRAAESP
jgi:hypothetical protein